LPDDLGVVFDKNLLSGGLKEILDYLKKQRIIKKRFSMDLLHGGFATNEIADHFWRISLEFLINLIDSFDGKEKQRLSKSLIAYITGDLFVEA